MTDRPTLSSEDQARVDQYLRSEKHQVQRRPFKPWRLLFLLIAFLTALSGVCYWVAVDHGVL